MRTHPVAIVKRVRNAKWFGLVGLLILLVHRILIHATILPGWSPNEALEQSTIMQWIWTGTILLMLNFAVLYWTRDPPKIVYYVTGFLGNMSVFFAITDVWIWDSPVVSQVHLFVGGIGLYYYGWALEPNRLAKRRAMAAATN